MLWELFDRLRLIGQHLSDGPRDLATLTFDLLTSKWVYGLLERWAPAVPILGFLARPFRSRVRSRRRATDRQTDGKTPAVTV